MSPPRRRWRPLAWLASSALSVAVVACAAEPTAAPAEGAGGKADEAGGASVPHRSGPVRGAFAAAVRPRIMHPDSRSTAPMPALPRMLPPAWDPRAGKSTAPPQVSRRTGPSSAWGPLWCASRLCVKLFWNHVACLGGG